MNSTVPSSSSADDIRHTSPRLLSFMPDWMLAPTLLWMGVFFFAPLFLMLIISFASRGTYGGIEWTLSFANYRALADTLYLQIYFRSLVFATITTALCLVLGFPLAYYIARAPVRWQGVWLILVMIPFWTNFLVRTYAWVFILRTEGLLNTVVMGLGLRQDPIEILYTDAAVLIGLVYGYLPFMVLPLYAAIERLDVSVVEAAWDLYASGWSVFWRVVLPLVKPGVIAGCLLVFIPSLGAFITPDLLGGARSMMVGNLIQHEYLVIRDWPFGSAIAFVLMGMVMLGVVGYLKVERA
ncbi:ABC transporter permease [Nitrospiraceae bacterium AH_259_D15_M11_P09]|nr:ABC transporter permease [Nitrospiraceae bacterium AH_259_D15_M11_P09]